MKKLLLSSIFAVFSTILFAQSKEVKISIYPISSDRSTNLKGCTVELYNQSHLVQSKVSKGKKNSQTIENEEYVIVVIKKEGYHDMYLALDMAEHKSIHKYTLNIPIRMYNLNETLPSELTTELCFGNVNFLAAVPVSDLVAMTTKN